MKRREHLNLLITVLGGLGLAIAGCSLEKSSDYRSASHAASTSRALDGSASHENSDIAAASTEANGPFRFVINLVHVRHRIPSEFLLVSKPQLVRIVARDEKLAKTVDFSKGINVTLRFKKPDSESCLR